MVMFRVCLYFSKSAGRFVFLYFLYKRLHFLIIFFISHVSQRDLILAVVGGVYCIFGTFSCGILGQVWYLMYRFLILL